MGQQTRSRSVRTPVPRNEDSRLEVLNAYRVLDTAPEEAFDRITRVAADLFKVPIALVSLIDRDRQWFKSCIGLGVSETGRDVSFCAHAILGDDVFVVPDASADPRFSTNPLVTGDPHIRFYAGAPLKTPEGPSLGSLCIIDTSPHDDFSSDDRRRLETFAALVVDLLQLRIGALDLRDEIEQRTRVQRELDTQRNLTELLQVVSVAANEASSIEEAANRAIDEVCRRIGWPLGHLFLIVNDVPVTTDTWGTSFQERFGPFRDATRTVLMRSGEGLPGLVQRNACFQVMPRPAEDDRFPRASAAAACGLSSGFGFPLMVGGEVAGVLEFYSTEATRPDEAILDTMTQVGTQLGRVIERVRAQREIDARRQLAASRAAAASRLAAIVHTSSDGIIGKTLEGQITSWNVAAERMYGWAADEIVGRSIQTIVPDDRPDEVPAILKKLRRGEAITSYETVRVRKDGRKIPVSVSISPVRGAAGDIIGAATIARDISQQKAMEAALRTSEERARSIIETASDAFVSMDIDGLVTDWNDSAERIFGWTRQETVGGRLSELIIPERYRDAHEAGLRRFLQTGVGPVIGRRIEIEARRRDGTELPVELAIWTTGGADDRSFNAFLTDISERKRAAEELKQNEEFKGAILASIAEGVIVSDADDRIVMINPAMETLGGCSLDEVKGRPLSEVYQAVDQRGEFITAEHPRVTELFVERDGSFISHGYEVALLRADGEQVPVSWTLAPIKDSRGRDNGRVAVLRDVTQEREVDQLKSSLVSTVSHELRTPLTMIQGFSELMLARDLGRDKEIEALGQIHSSAERLARLIDELLSVSRIDSGSLDPVLAPTDLPTLIDLVVQTFAVSGRHLSVQVEADLPMAMADPDMTVQVLTNLISNAIKYSPAEKPVRIQIWQDDTCIQVAVTDEGIGLSEEQLERLFEKFFRADSSDVRETPGTGLGLYITKNLVELQGGRIWATSQLGHGSTFTFTAPVADESVSPSAKAEPR